MAKNSKSEVLTADEIITVGTNIRLAKTLCELLYSGLNKEIDIANIEMANISVLLQRLMEEIYNQFEEVEKKLDI